MPEPSDQKLYNYVKSLANKKFTSHSGIYRSSWIVKEYKKRGGEYDGPKDKNSGLTRWFKENWVDLNRPKRNSKGEIIGYHKCGRESSKVNGKYPLCRPSERVNSKTPKTYKELSSSSIEKAKKLKAVYTSNKNISFSKKRSTKKRSTKKRSTKKTSTKKRSTKKKSTKKRSTKKRSTKKKSTKKRSTKL